MTISDYLQLIAGCMFAFAYVPLIVRMKKNESSEDVSLIFLFMIWVALFMSNIYSFDKFFIEYGVHSFWDNGFMPLMVTNILNSVMVSIAVYYAVKLRR